MSTTSGSRSRKPQRRVLLVLALGVVWLFVAPVVRTVFDLSSEGVLIYRLSTLVLLGVAVALHVRPTRSHA